MATIAALSSISSPAAFAARTCVSSEKRLGSSFNGRQLAPALPVGGKAHSAGQVNGVRAFIGGPCGPRGARFGRRGFYGRGYGPQGVVVVPVPGPGVWTDCSPPDPEQFEEYQKRQKAAYEERRAAYEARRAAWEVEAQKQRELREKQAEFFRRQREELAEEQRKWRSEYWNRPETAQTETTEKPETTKETSDAPPKEEAPAVEKDPEAPPKYPQSDTPVLHLRNEVNGADITVVGTAHSTEASVDAVRRTIREEQPTSVLVQLDRQRYNRLAAATPEQAFFSDMLRAFVGPVGGVVGAGMLGFYGMLAYRGMNIGREFKVAIQEARRAGAKIILGDQKIDETMRRAEAAMSPAAIQTFFSQPMPQDILDELSRGMGPGPWGAWGMLAGGPNAVTWGEALRDRKVVRALNAYMARAAPELYKVMVEQRTEALVRALRHCEGKTVAVVDISHLDGIEQAWQELNETARTERQAEVAAAEGKSAPADVIDADVEEVAPVADADVIDGVTSEEEEKTTTASGAEASKDVSADETKEESASTSDGAASDAAAAAPEVRAEGAEQSAAESEEKPSESSDKTADKDLLDFIAKDSDSEEERGPEEQPKN